MRVLILKGFRLSNREFKKDEIIDISVSAFHKLSLKGLVKPHLLDISEEERLFLKAEFERIFTEHIQKLSEMPITASIIKELYPECYQQLKKLEAKMDEAWLTFDYVVLTEALREIEETMQSCLIYQEIQYKQKPKPVQKELNRACINCGNNFWLILKPNSRNSIIQCVKCNHTELYIRGNSEQV